MQSPQFLAAALLVASFSAPALATSVQAPTAIPDEPSLVQGDAASLVRFAVDLTALMPTVPHEKTRSRLQSELVESALDAGELEVARAIPPTITNWRRGLGLATIAAHLAENGTPEETQDALEAAIAFEESITGEFDQGWRRDRVRAMIGKTFALMGDPVRAARIQRGLEPSEAQRLAEVSVDFASEENWRESVEAMSQLIVRGNLDQVQHGLLTLTKIYERFGTTTEERDEILAAIRSVWDGSHLQPRIEALLRMIETDLGRGDKAHAMSMVEEIEGLIAGNRWQPEMKVGMLATAAAKRFRCGDEDGAREALAGALGLFGDEREGIVNMFRVRALLPLAEAYAEIGNTQSADEVYRVALTEALENPNERPRIDNLVQIVRSIVERGHRPSKGLRTQVQQVGDLVRASYAAKSR
ncbi:MAG: hypothetical protein AAFU73_20850 [Planctomycetota bacterium]